MPNITLSEKLLSLEVLASALVSIFLIGGSWFSLSYASETNANAIDELKHAQKATVEDISKIKTDVATLLISQQALSKANDQRLESIDQSVNDVRDLIQKIHLKELGR